MSQDITVKSVLKCVASSGNAALSWGKWQQDGQDVTTVNNIEFNNVQEANFRASGRDNSPSGAEEQFEIHTEFESLSEDTPELYAEREQFDSKYFSLVATASLVKVVDAQGRLRTARVILDNGSTSHFVTQHLCEKLGVLQQGSLVLVKDKNQPPLLWLLGRVLKVHPGRDNINHVADILTKKGVIQRAYNNICPLLVSAASS
ncbi:unnamed protein product, partial [Iphiclides podalirius]